MSTDAGETPLAREYSFGGIVLCEGKVLVIVPRGKHHLTLPKGGANPGESGEDAALREVFEETGIEAVIREPLGAVRYRYRRHGLLVVKTVRFWRCEYVGGELGGDPAEVAQARWIDVEHARSALAHPGERELLTRALPPAQAQANG